MGCEKCKHLEPKTKYCSKQDKIILNGQMKFACLEFDEGEFEGPERLGWGAETKNPVEKVEATEEKNIPVFPVRFLGFDYTILKDYADARLDIGNSACIDYIRREIVINTQGAFPDRKSVV